MNALVFGLVLMLIIVLVALPQRRQSAFERAWAAYEEACERERAEDEFWMAALEKHNAEIREEYRLQQWIERNAHAEAWLYAKPEDPMGDNRSYV